MSNDLATLDTFLSLSIDEFARRYIEPAVEELADRMVREELALQFDAEAEARAAQERLHRQIGQWARVGHRRVREKALEARLAMGLPA